MSIKSRELAQPHDPIWASPAPGARKPRFTRAEIAASALTIADTEGFAAVSMRRVAEELGAGTMTLYHYVRTKEDLVTLMDDELMAQVLIPPDELADDWREALAQIARASYAVFRKHPWAMEALSGSQFGPNSLRHFEQSLGAVANAPFSAQRDRLELLGIVDDYTFGAVLRDAEMMAKNDGLPAGEAREWRDSVPSPALVEFMTAQLASGEYPNLAALVEGGDPMAKWPEMARVMNDAGRFERGLQALLDGLELRADKQPAKPTKAARPPKPGKPRATATKPGRRRARP